MTLFALQFLTSLIRYFLGCINVVVLCFFRSLEASEAATKELTHLLVSISFRFFNVRVVLNLGHTYFSTFSIRVPFT